MKIIITILISVLCIILAVFEPAEGLECYSCSYIETDGHGIGDPECKTGKSQNVETCNQFGNSKPACTVTEVNGENTKSTIRACGFAGGDGKAGCHMTKAPTGSESNHCICFGDKCNSADVRSLSKSSSANNNNNLGLSAAGQLLGLVCLSFILYCF